MFVVREGVVTMLLSSELAVLFLIEEVTFQVAAVLSLKLKVVLETPPELNNLESVNFEAEMLELEVWNSIVVVLVCIVGLVEDVLAG